MRLEVGVLLFLRAIGPPIAPSARLQPCAVELEHVAVHYGPHDEMRFVTHRVAVTQLVRNWEDARPYRDWERSPIAPIPLTRAQTLALPDASRGDGGTVVLLLADSSLVYRFDAANRTAQVDFFPAADQGTYRFRYRYGCPSAAPIVWTD